MKRFLALFSIVTLLFAACETSEQGGSNGEQIKLTTSETLNVGSGNAVAFLKYEILDFISGAEVKATADVEWIGNFSYKEQGKIQFTVEKNPNDEPREGKITVTYDRSQFEVTVIQALSENPTNKDIEMPMLQGKYYGIQAGMYNYYLVFSDLGLDGNNMFSTPNAHYYFVDLYLLTEPSDMNNIVIPVGEYEYDITNSGYANTFIESFSWYQVNDESGIDLSQTHYDKGKLIVEEDRVILEVAMTIDDVDQIHRVIYNGDYSLIDCTHETYQ